MENEFGVLLRDARQKARLTQQNLWLAAHEEAGKRGLVVDELRRQDSSHKQLSAWERGTNRPGLGAAGLVDLLDSVLAARGALREGALRRAHQKLWGADTDRSEPVTDDVTLLDPHHRPAQLSAPTAVFAGRGETMRVLLGLADKARTAADGLASSRGSGSPAIAAITGQPGVGKTALARRFAHDVKHLFPDGQLEADLHGLDREYDEVTVKVLTNFLLALGVPSQDVPQSPERLSSRFRDLTSQSRLLILLDNVADEEQVRPLLPGGNANLVILTSRSELGLPQATPVPLPVLNPDEALELVTLVLGPDTISDDPTSTQEVIQLCGSHPLALWIALSQLKLPGRSGWTVATLRDLLADERQRLDMTVGNIALRATFALSFDRLADDAAHVFRHLGDLAGDDVAAAAVGAAAARPQSAVRGAMRTLVAAHLVEEPQVARYRLHDLLALYSRDLYSGDLLEGREPPDYVQQARRRELEYYRDTAVAHAESLAHLGPVGVDALEEGNPRRAEPQTEALRWFASERHNLASVLRRAQREQVPDHQRLIVDLALAGQSYYQSAGHSSDLLETHLVAERAAHDLADSSAAAGLQFGIGDAYRRRREFSQGRVWLTRSRELHQHLGNRQGELTSVLTLAHLEREDGKHALSLSLYDQARDLAESAKDNLRTAVARNGIAAVCLEVKQYARAREEATQALKLLEPPDNTWESAYERAWAHSNLAQAVAAVGEPLIADREHTDSVHIFESMGSIYGLGLALKARGALRQSMNRWDPARDDLTAAAAKLANGDDVYALASCLELLGTLHGTRGRRQEAARCYQQAAAALGRTGRDREVRRLKQLARSLDEQ